MIFAMHGWKIAGRRRKWARLRRERSTMASSRMSIKNLGEFLGLTSGVNQAVITQKSFIGSVMTVASAWVLLKFHNDITHEFHRRHCEIRRFVLRSFSIKKLFDKLQGNFGFEIKYPKYVAAMPFRAGLWSLETGSMVFCFLRRWHRSNGVRGGFGLLSWGGLWLRYEQKHSLRSDAEHAEVFANNWPEWGTGSDFGYAFHINANTFGCPWTVTRLGGTHKFKLCRAEQPEVANESRMRLRLESSSNSLRVRRLLSMLANNWLLFLFEVVRMAITRHCSCTMRSPWPSPAARLMDCAKSATYWKSTVAS